MIIIDDLWSNIFATANTAVVNNDNQLFSATGFEWNVPESNTNQKSKKKDEM